MNKVSSMSFNVCLSQLDILKQTTSHVLLVAKKSRLYQPLVFSRVWKCTESCKELHISFHPIVLHLLRDGSDWTTTRAISKVS